MSARTEKLIDSVPEPAGALPARILVVDDRPTSRAVVKGVLGASEHIVREAASGAQALELIETEPFDLVVLDILMPDIDGFEVLRNIRAMYTELELPVIMVTVKHQSGDVVDALSRGANDYVTKPIDFPVLLARIQAQITRKRAEDALRESQESLAREVGERTEELLRITGVLQHEVTERRQAEEARRVREEQFRDFAQVAADWFWEMDPELRFAYVSERFEDVTGWKPTEVLGRTRRDIFGGRAEKSEMWESHFQDLEMRRAFEGLEFLWERPDGTTRVLRLSGKPIFDENGVFQGYRGAGCDVTEARHLSEELSYQASHDSLTGLVNRVEFEQRLRRALATTRLPPPAGQVEVRAAEHVLLYLDLDQFKVINDTCGHVAGDELLRQVGELLREQVRPRDTVARLGGDEFGILMEHRTLDQALRVAEGLCKAIEHYDFEWDEKHFSIGASIGIAPIDCQMESIGAALSAADSACFAAKDQGRNRIHLYRKDDAHLAKWHGEIEWIGRIDRALQHDRFELFYQPIVPIDDREEGARYEFLLRMRDEEGNLVLPGTFLPAAERYHLAIKLDRWVVTKAFSWLHSHPEHLEGMQQCSINLSARSLVDDSFLDFVNRKLSEHHIPARKICFEITETAAIANLVAATRFIKALKARGCMFSLDDFGSGFSSFAYLKNLPVDILKIDGMFVRDVLDDPLELAMVRSINEIGHVMGKQTVAEFVEDAAILSKLREAGVDFAQGYAIGVPRPIDD